MRINILLILFILIILGIGIYFIFPSQNQQTGNMSFNMDFEKNKNLIIRNPAVAGQFYPFDESELSQMIDGFLNNAKVNEVNGTPKILIVPHAGYIFSGQTAARGFKVIQGQNYEKVILLGNSHQEYFDGLILDKSDIWQTPLGQVELDRETVEKLVAENDKIKTDTRVHLSEHSLEVEVPFLQKVLGNFKIIPGLFGSDNNLNDLKAVAAALKEVVDDKTLVVVSTDLSHYPNYEDAKAVDQETVEAILAGDAEKFLQTINKLESRGIENLSTCACGWPAVAVAMYLASNMNLTGELLSYTNSGDAPLYGDKERVVGYAALVFSKQTESDKQQVIGKKLNKEEQEAALKLARNTLERAFDNNVQKYEDYKNYDIFKEKRGVFVTLYKNGELRGCIGLIEPPEVPLGQAIQQMALSAAFNDHRFLPLTQDELGQIKIEISVLTVPKRIKSIEEIELGKHGVIVKKGLNQGVFLPQVATETGWTKEQFLSELCYQKAGLDRNCWQDPSAEFYIFEAQVFEE